MDITLRIEAPELAAAINNLASALASNRSTEVVKEKAPSKKATKEEKAEAAMQDTATMAVVTEKVTAVNSAEYAEKSADMVPAESAPETEEEVTYTLEQVREKLSALSQAGKQKQVKELISSYGVAKLTDIPADVYGELMKKAGELK